MTITLTPEIEAAVEAQAQQQNTTVEDLALSALQEKFVPKQREAINGIVPVDDWMERLLRLGKDCGVSLSNEAVSSEGIYD